MISLFTVRAIALVSIVVYRVSAVWQITLVILPRFLNIRTRVQNSIAPFSIQPIRETKSSSRGYRMRARAYKRSPGESRWEWIEWQLGGKIVQIKEIGVYWSNKRSDLDMYQTVFNMKIS